MSVDLLLAALVPLTIVLWWTGSQSSSELTEAARKNTSLLARATAARLDQLLLDTSRFAESVASDDRIVALCADPGAAHESPVYAAALRRLELAEQTNPDCASAFITNAKGMGIASTNPKNIGMDLSFRDYCMNALDGRANASDFLVGKTTGEPGVYFATPVRSAGAGSTVVGAAVFKLRGERIWEIIREVRIQAEGFVLLADRHGVVIAHPDATKHFHSLGPLTPQEQAAAEPDRTYSVDRIDALGAPALLSAARNRDVTPWEASSFVATSGFGDGSSGDWVAGAARMRTQPWTVFAVEPATQFNSAAAGLAQRNLMAAAAVGLLAAGLALWRARGVVRPVLDLTAAAERLAQGDFTARAPQHAEDEIGRLAGSFNAMVPRLHEAVELRQAIQLATDVQQALLPSDAMKFDGMEVVGRCRYCDETGGDYFDFIDVAPTAGGGMLIAVGDVMGHGLPAALLMASARAALRCPVAPDTRLSEMLGRVNHVLDSDRNFQFMTLTLLLVDPRAGSARWASAGHDPPILLRAGSGEFSELEGGDVPLGVDGSTAYEEYRGDGLCDGDLIFIGTDGIWEAENSERKMYGKDRLRAVLREHSQAPVGEIADAVERELESFRGEVPQKDDVTFVVIRIRGAGDAGGGKA